MTTEEKKLMENPEHKPLMDLPPVVQHLMRANPRHLKTLLSSGLWLTVEEADLFNGCVYTVKADAPVSVPQPTYKRYPVFCSSADGVYKVNLTKEGTDNTRIYHLHTVTGMVNFAGIRYHGSQEWKPTMDTVTHGVPSEVRFAIR